MPIFVTISSPLVAPIGDMTIGRIGISLMEEYHYFWDCFSLAGQEVGLSGWIQYIYNPAQHAILFSRHITSANNGPSHDFFANASRMQLVKIIEQETFRENPYSHKGNS